MSGPEASPADFQLALDAMRDGVILWSPGGRLVVGNQTVARLMGMPPALVVRGATRLDLMTFLARRGDYGPTDDPDGLARDLSDRFGTGEVSALTRRLPDGRFLRALSRRLDDGRVLVIYEEVPAEAASVSVS